MNNMSRIGICVILLTLAACESKQAVNSAQEDERRIMAQTDERSTKLHVCQGYCDLMGFDPVSKAHSNCVLQLDIASSTNHARSFSNRYDKEFKSKARLSPTERIKIFKQRCEAIGFAPATEPYANCLLNLELAFYKAKTIAESNRYIDKWINEAIFLRNN